MTKKPELTCLDLFAGCGGLSLGLEQAGFTPLFVNELNPDAMESYLVNREQINPLLRKKFHLNDVKDLVKNEGDTLNGLLHDIKKEYGIDAKKGEVDLLVGGPPCQGYSGIGHRRSYSVDKKQLPSNHLYQDMSYIVNRVRPKIFMFENVKGLLSARWTKGGEKGEIWTDVKEAFRSIEGYTVKAALIHAKDYGVPQNRPRVLLVGIRDDIRFEPNDVVLAERQDLDMTAVAAGYLPAPLKEKSPNLADLLGDLVDPNYVNGETLRTLRYPKSATRNIQKALRRDPVTGRTRPVGSLVTEHEYSKHAPHVVERFQAMILNGEIPPHLQTKKFAQRVLPEKWGSQGPTLTATSMPDDYVHFEQPRILTVREWARLQMFPDWYQFAGKRTTGGIRRAGNPREGIHDREAPKYTQIGNAVPVELAKHVGLHFKGLLGQ